MVRIVNHSRGAIGLGRLYSETLRPGVNEVDPAVWDRVKTAPAIAAMLKLGRDGGLTVSGAPESTPEPEPFNSPVVPEPEPIPEPEPEAVTVPDLDEMNAADAKETIAECDDPEVLGEWLRTETRKTVVTAIDKRLAALENDTD